MFAKKMKSLKNNIYILFFIILIILVFLSSPVYAGGKVGDFNYNETTGLINIPVAKVAPRGTVEVSVQCQDIGEGRPGTLPGEAINLDDLGFRNDGSFRAIWGIAKNVEISGMLLHGGLHRSIYGIKWLAVPGGHRKIAFAVGVQSIGMKNENNLSTGGAIEPEHFTKPSFFGVASYAIPLNEKGTTTLDLHAGGGTARLRNGFCGAELHFSPKISAIGEYDGTISTLGLKYYASRRFNILFATQLQKRVRYGLSISYRFGNAPKETLENNKKN